MIEQDIFLFSRSISDNIAFGKPGASHEEVLNAAKCSASHMSLLRTPDESYETVIGERGVTLFRRSTPAAGAGPRILKPIPASLSWMIRPLQLTRLPRIKSSVRSPNAARGRTTILITHRLSQIRLADLIIVMRMGRISEMGTHEELMKTSEAYSRIFKE